jgi:hypothetical protein
MRGAAGSALFAAASALAAAATGCAKNEPDMLRDRAAEAMKCDPERVAIGAIPTHGDNVRAYKATGCGGEVVYRCEDAMEQIAARDMLTGSDVRSQTACKPVE